MFVVEKEMSNVTETGSFILLASGYVALTSIGCVVAVVLAWVILYILECKRGRSTREAGSFSRLMLLIQAIDSIPEAMVISSIVVAGQMTAAFSVSVFMLNLVSALVIALDFLATRPERIMHRLLLILVFFSIGLLFFSVSSTVFDRLVAHVQSDYMLLFSIFGGMSIGIILVWVVLITEQRIGRRLEQQQRERVDPIDTLRDTLAHETALRHQVKSLDSPRPEIVAVYDKRIADLARSIETVENARRLSNDTNLSVADENCQVIEEAALISDDNNNNIQYLNISPLHRRALILTGMMLLIVGWTIVLSTIFTPVFMILDQADVSDHVNAFVDGMSGGTFLSIISSTLIPRLQQDAYRTHWTAMTCRVAGMISFAVGISTAFLLELIPTLAN